MNIDTKPQLLSVAELLNRPDPDWLVQDILPESGLTLLYGASGYGKSFVAIDLAMAVATGTDWMGQFPVEQGAVVYIAAEGLSGIKKRVAAWQCHHEDTPSPTGLNFCLQAVDLYDDDSRDALMEALEERFPTLHEHLEHRVDRDTGDEEVIDHNPFPLRLIVIDTLARMYQGESENDSAQMGDFIRRVQYFAEDCGAVVLLVHHTGKDGEKERGSGSLRGAMETCIKIRGKKKHGRLDSLQFIVDKQKDGEEITLAMSVVNVELPHMDLDSAGRVQKSAVLELTDDTTDMDPLLVLLKDEGGLTNGQWMKKSGLSNSSFNRKIKAFVEEGLVEKDEDGLYVLVGSSSPWGPPEEEE